MSPNRNAGRIRAIQLDYTVAHASLLQAIRRGPSDFAAAPGFFQHAHKLLVLVSLLMGEIPERKVFREPVLRKALRPYLEIAQGGLHPLLPPMPYRRSLVPQVPLSADGDFHLPTAVRVGDIQAFNAALEQHSRVFTADRNLSLVHRLRHNVIKTALRTISLAYSRISLRDISAKLALDSEEDAEYIVAKAIRDGVVVAQIDHEKGEMTSRETSDVYSTGEPMKEFDRRIGFLLDLYNQSVKVRAQFPPWSPAVSSWPRLGLATDLAQCTDRPCVLAVDAIPAQCALEGTCVCRRSPRTRA